MLFKQLGKLVESFSDLTTVLHTDPNNMIALRERCIVCILQENWDCAIMDAMKLCELDPPDKAPDPTSKRRSLSHYLR